MIGRSGDTMCDLYRAKRDDEHGFLDCASKPRSTGFSVWASKLIAAVW
jgi:hypothetical protein